MKPDVITIDPEAEYTLTFRVWYRKRKPPKREPRWISDLNPIIRDVERTGAGAHIPDLITPEGLAKLLASAQKIAGENHVLYVSIIFGDSNAALFRSTRRVANWSAWTGWTTATITERSPV